MEIGASECCGCGACAVVCPTCAIVMKEAKDGFLYPVIDETKCIHCNKCEQACFLSAGYGRIDGSFEQVCYAAWSTDDSIRALCQSGGIGYMLAKKVVDRGGKAYGAAFDGDFVVQHVCAESVRECEAFRGAKYVQSQFSQVYVSIRDNLFSGKPVIVFGTPCQIMGLRRILATIDDSKLYLVDLVCHGVPSPGLWKDYVHWLRKKYNGEKLEKIIIRDPSFGWRNSIGNYCFDGRWHTHTEWNSLFGGDLMLRSSCYSCRFANLERPGDLTIGDCWGIERTSLTVDDFQGVSIVLANTKVGKELLQGLQSIRIEKIDIQDVLQAAFRRPVPMLPQREQFWIDYYQKGIDYVIFKYANGGWLGPIRRRLRPFKEYLLQILDKMQSNGGYPKNV